MESGYVVDVCLGARLLEGFVGFDTPTPHCQAAHNIYSVPTTGEIDLGNGKVLIVTIGERDQKIDGISLRCPFEATSDLFLNNYVAKPSVGLMVLSSSDSRKVSVINPEALTTGGEQKRSLKTANKCNTFAFDYFKQLFKTT